MYVCFIFIVHFLSLPPPPCRADYWRTDPRYYCEVCKCWLGNNKISIQNHEKGLRHKGSVEKQLRETRKRAAVKERDEEKVTETLAQIEKAAEAAYKRDQKGLPAKDSSYLKKALAEEEKKMKSKPKKGGGGGGGGGGEAKSSTDVAAPPPPPSPWQQLLSPEGRIYYYHILTGISQWECPPELKTTPSHTSVKSTVQASAPKGSSVFGTFTRNAKGSIVPVTSSNTSNITSADDDSIQAQWLRQQQEKDEFLQQPFTELAARVKYYTANSDDDDGDGDGEGGGESGEGEKPPPTKRFDPYGSWKTVAVRAQKIVEEEKEEDEGQEEIQPKQSKSSRLQVSSDEEEDCTFQEKTHPQTNSNSSDPLVKREDGEGMMTGSFKGFSFKKKSSSSNRNIKQRTSQW